MSDIQNSNLDKIDKHEDEIDLRELILALWRNKYIILSIAIIAAVLTGLYSLFMLSPVYQTKLDIVVNMPEKYNTRYGEYTLPIKSNKQYIDLITSNQVLLNTKEDLGYGGSVDGLRSRISIKSSDEKEQNTFTVLVSADDPEKSLQLAQALYKNYVEFVDVMIRDRIVEYFYNQLNTDLTILEKTLESKYALLKMNEDLLAKMPKFFNQKEAMLEVQESLNGSIDYIVLGNIINSSYLEVEKNIISLQQEIFVMEDTIQKHNEQLNALEEQKKLIADYYETGNYEKVAQLDVEGIVKNGIYMPSQAVAPGQKISPNSKRNVAIGLVIGLMLGLIIAYIKEFWVKEQRR